jgi:hypothetical protein
MSYVVDCLFQLWDRVSTIHLLLPQSMDRFEEARNQKPPDLSKLMALANPVTSFFRSEFLSNLMAVRSAAKSGEGCSCGMKSAGAAVDASSA